MIGLVAIIGEILALVTLAMGVIGFLQFYARTRYTPHLAMLPTVILVLGPSLFLFQAYSNGNPDQAMKFLVLQALGLPFYTYWAEQNRRRMEQIAATGHFDPGFPLPSDNHVALSLFGQLYQDLAQPIVVLEGAERLNMILERYVNNQAILSRSRFTDKGEFMLDRDSVLKVDQDQVRKEELVDLFEAIVDHFAKIANIDDHEELRRIVRSNCGRTVNKYMDYLIEEGLLHTIYDGVLTSRISTGISHLDKALDGGLPKGMAMLLVAGPNQEKEDFARAFIQTGLDQGEGSLVVSATRTPDKIRSDLNQGKSRLRIVDCYTSRFTEVPTLETHEDTYVSPVALSVVEVAMSRALEAIEPRKKRALVDILSAYLVSSRIETIYPHIMEMVDRFRKANCTVVFMLNPMLVEDEADLAMIKELFDCVLKLRQAETPVLDFEKLGFSISSGRQSYIRQGIQLSRPDSRKASNRLPSES